MSDFNTDVEEYESVESDDEVEADTDDEAEATTDNGEQPAAETLTVPAAVKRQKDELPTGWVTPTGLKHLLIKEGIVADITPQQCYGFAKTGSGFPVRFHTDGRYITPVPSTVDNAATVSNPNQDNPLEPEVGNPEKDALAWVRRQLNKRAERDAAKQAKLAAQATAAQTPADS